MKSQKLNYSMSVCTLFFLVFISISCKSISTKNYKIESPLITGKSCIKILLISDLHSTVYGNDQEVLINKISVLRPDLIILSGDLFDSSSPMTGAISLLKGISGIAPIYYVTGNHEYWGNNVRAAREILLSFGVIILSDTYVLIEINNNELILAGIEDPEKKLFETPDYNQEDAMENAFRELDEIPLYKILIAHRPENIEIYKRYSFNLVLSGHTHGGQVRIPPIVNGLYTRNQGLFPKYGGGIYKPGNTTLIISRGLSLNYPKSPRIFNSPELVLITINN